MGRDAPGDEDNTASELQGNGEQELGEQLSQVLPADTGLPDERRVRQGAADLQRRRHVWNVHPHVGVIKRTYLRTPRAAFQVSASSCSSKDREAMWFHLI